MAGTFADSEGGSTGVEEAILLDARAETDTSAALEVIRARRNLLGHLYPFNVCDKGSVSYRGSSTCVYEFCLATSLQTDLSSAPYCELPVAFERLVGHVVSLWAGKGSCWFRMGWPPKGDRPATFRAAVEKLSGYCSDFSWCATSSFYVERGTRDVKDGGCDIVVWRRPDDRIGGLLFMGQCACGDNWDTKLKDLDLRELSQKYVRITHDVTRFFATPFDVGHEQTWLDATVTAGTVFDRMRITALAESRENRQKILKAAIRPYEELVRLVDPRCLATARCKPKSKHKRLRP